ncbi:bifunctional polynucleotide phosphatase/kinase [Aplysia californica]|uniref:Bifunctional polynucleotide phosphatase/kinase n=1 Tax=Aplysia californica TaxID=6500 RepID=A0ABM0JCI6_APLCA|nr:bifunctional polynucleotide phosphatase/kinase [Aplysia californica]
MLKAFRSMSTSRCFLVCLQKSHEDVLLPDGVPVSIGRTPVTKITDPRCSRQQVELTADCAKRKVKVKQLGANLSAVDGNPIGKDKEIVIGSRSTLFILSGQYPHKITFKSDSFSKENKPKETSEAETSDPGKVNEKDCDRKEDSKKNKSDSKKENKSDAEKKSTDNGVVDERDKKLSKKRQSVDAGTEPQLKKQRTNEDSSHSVKKSKKEDREKKKADSNGDEHRPKKQKSDMESSGSVKKSKKEDNDETKIDSDDEEHVQDVSDRLQQMKQSVKEKKTAHSSASSKDSKPKTSSRSKSSDSQSSTCGDKRSDNSFLKPQTPVSESKWSSHEHLYVYTSKGVVHQSKIAGFDIDGTIIITKSGRTFPTDSSDWQVAYGDTFRKLKSLHADGHKIVFFTNQLGVAKGKTKIEDLKTKIENIISKLQVPVQAFVATHEGKYRKPCDGMWKKLKHEYNGGVNLDLSSSLYVGDAAGRPKDWAPKKKKDFSLSDRLFAINVGLKFHTPEEFFLGQKEAPYTMPVFDPRKLRSDVEAVPQGCDLDSKSKEIILLVGFPASGKSHFASHILKPKGYECVNRDTLGTWQKCVKKAKESLVHSKVVVENTNLTKEERARYVELAKDAHVPCRCFLFTTTIEHCRHNERFRQLIDKSHAKINEMIFHQIKNKYQEPSMNEGFSKIVNINFVPKFSSTSLEAQYKKFLLEK